VSKYRFRDSDIYLPGSDIPANRCEIADPELLHEVEAIIQTGLSKRPA
jgi:hypothetical protein